MRFTESDILLALQRQLSTAAAWAEVVIAPDWPVNHPGLIVEFAERQVLPLPGPWLRIRARLRCQLVGPSEILEAAERELLTVLHRGLPPVHDASGQRVAEIIGLQWLNSTHAQPDGLIATRTVDFEAVLIRRQFHSASVGV